MSPRNHILALARGSLIFVCLAAMATPSAQPAAPQQSPAEQHPPPMRPGVHTPGVSRPLSSIQTQAVFPVEGNPDWSVVTKAAVWVTSGRTNHVVQLVIATNKPGLVVEVPEPCSGIANGFGAIWSPSCRDKAVLRIDPATGKVIASVAAEPANSEGGIAVGAGLVWIVTKPSTLVGISPQTNAVTVRIPLPAGSENPIYDGGFLWVSSYQNGALLKVDPVSHSVVATIAVGPKPRFLTSGAGSVWTLNQGDGTISRVDQASGRLVATIPAGIPGPGGEITFGYGFVWATMFKYPVTQVDPKTNTVVKQWAGDGGDGIRFGAGSIWLSNGRQGNVWRFSPNQK